MCRARCFDAGRIFFRCPVYRGFVRGLCFTPTALTCPVLCDNCAAEGPPAGIGGAACANPAPKNVPEVAISSAATLAAARRMTLSRRLFLRPEGDLIAVSSPIPMQSAWRVVGCVRTTREGRQTAACEVAESETQAHRAPGRSNRLRRAPSLGHTPGVTVQSSRHMLVESTAAGEGIRRPTRGAFPCPIPGPPLGV